MELTFQKGLYLKAFIVALLLPLFVFADEPSSSSGLNSSGSVAESNSFLLDLVKSKLIHEEIDLGNDDKSGLSREKTKVLLPREKILSNEKVPMVMLLHGYSGTGLSQAWYLKILEQLNKKKFILVLPEGKLEKRAVLGKKKNQFWDANNYCCDFRKAGEKAKGPIEDIQYLTQVTEYLKRNYPVDEKRIYLFGHSNGAMMAHRMACEKSEWFAGVAAYGGTMVQETSLCSPQTAISVLQIHGTNDRTIRYKGNQSPRFTHPGAEASIQRWRKLNQCEAELVPETRLDLDSEITGYETETFVAKDCSDNSQVALWKINEGVHTPSPTAIKKTFSESILDWLFSQQKR